MFGILFSCPLYSWAVECQASARTDGSLESSHWDLRSLADRAHPMAPARWRQLQALGQPQPQALGTFLEMGMCWGQARVWAQWGPWVGRARLQGAGHQPFSAASLAQGLMALGDGHGVRGLGQREGSPGPGRASRPGSTLRTLTGTSRNLRQQMIFEKEKEKRKKRNFIINYCYEIELCTFL